jgi:hypothetical protein
MKACLVGRENWLTETHVNDVCHTNGGKDVSMSGHKLKAHLDCLISQTFLIRRDGFCISREIPTLVHLCEFMFNEIEFIYLRKGLPNNFFWHLMQLVVLHHAAAIFLSLSFDGLECYKMHTASLQSKLN